MNVETFEVSQAEAIAKAQAYAAEPHADARDFYDACRRAYEAVAEGGTVLHLSRSFQIAGLGEDGRPRLAIARADRHQVYMRWRRGERRATFDASANQEGSRWPTLVRTVDLGQVHDDHSESHDGTYRWDKERRGYALVPQVPADVRPETGQLRDWHVLWEVDEWSDTSLLAEPPRDPLLLEHVGGELYIVRAQWDLTEIERAIMAEMSRD